VTNIATIIVQVLAVITSLIYLVERPGDGAAKKAEALAAAKTLIAALPIPGWAKMIFCLDVILGFLIDLAVAGLNKIDWLENALAPG